MPIKVGSDEVITDTKQLANISDTDSTTQTAINGAIVTNNHKLEIKDAAGNVVRTLFVGKDPNLD
jgi:hypothetical protein